MEVIIFVGAGFTLILIARIFAPLIYFLHTPKNGYGKVELYWSDKKFNNLTLKGVKNPKHFPDAVTTIYCIFEKRKKQGVGLENTLMYKGGRSYYSLAKWKDDVQLADTELSITQFNETTMIKEGLLVELEEKKDRINKIIKVLKSEDSEAIEKLYDAEEKRLEEEEKKWREEEEKKWLEEEKNRLEEEDNKWNIKREEQLEEEGEEDSSTVESSKSDDRSNPIPYSSSGTTYSVYNNPQNNYKAVKIGWSHPGFFFGIFWCLSKQLWKPAGILFAIGFVFGATGNLFLDVVATLGVMIWMGSNGNRLYDQRLEDRGYDFLSIVNAKTPDGAIAQYHKETNEEKED